MKKIIVSLFLLSSSLFSSQQLEDRHVFKKYVSIKEISFRDGHFRIQRKGKPLVKLKTLRANNAGVYYIPRDICKNKKLHRDHDKNKDSENLCCCEEKGVEILREKRHGGCKNRPSRSERRYPPPGPRGDGWHDKPEAGANGPRGRYAVKEVGQDGPCGLPETVRHDHYFNAPGANGAGG